MAIVNTYHRILSVLLPSRDVVSIATTCYKNERSNMSHVSPFILQNATTMLKKTIVVILFLFWKKYTPTAIKKCRLF